MMTETKQINVTSDFFLRFCVKQQVCFFMTGLDCITTLQAMMFQIMHRRHIENNIIISSPGKFYDTQVTTKIFLRFVYSIN